HGQEGHEQERGDHACFSSSTADSRPLRMNRPMARQVMSAENTGNHTEYHHCGTPMPGEVSSKRKSSHTTRTLSTAMTPKSKAVISAPKRASTWRRRAEPPSANHSIRMCTSRATAAEPATMASRIMRKTEISSVQANEELVK